MKYCLAILGVILTVLTVTVLGCPSVGTAYAGFNYAAVTINIAENRSANSQPWYASGGIDDRGTIETIWFLDVAGSSTTPRIVHIDSKFTNAEETGWFIIRRNLISTPMPGSSRSLETGTWCVTSASGAYLGMRGQGIVAGADNAGVVSDSLYGITWCAK